MGTLMAVLLAVLLAGPVQANFAIHDVLVSSTDALISEDTGFGKHLNSTNNDSKLQRSRTINQSIQIQLSAMGRDMQLQLEPSRFNALAQQYSKPGSAPTLYQGTINGDNQSWVRVNLHNNKLSGHLFHQGKLYQLEERAYLEKINPNLTSTSEHVLFEPAASAATQGLLNALLPQPDPIQFAPKYPLSNQPAIKLLTNQYSTRSNQIDSSLELIKSGADGLGTTVTRALRMGIVVDSRFDETHKNRGLARALSIVSAVDAIYQSQLGIAILLESISVYDDPETDPMRNNGGSVNEILSNFREVRINDKQQPADLSVVHLFTGHRDPNRVIGLGWISTACRLDGYDVSVSTPFPFDTLLAAHEIAHNLGAVHDDDMRCAAPVDDQQTTLMWPEISSNSTTEFSSCSRRFMQASKNASCNLDNIDAAINISSYPSSEELQRSVIVEVSNNDVLGRATELMSTIEFPRGTRFSDLSAGCIASNSSIECNHGTVNAGESSSIGLAATLLNDSQENVVATVDLLNASDVDDIDNRQAIQLLQFEVNSAEANVADNEQLFNDEAGASDDLITGLGRTSISLLMGLFLIFSFRRQWV